MIYRAVRNFFSVRQRAPRCVNVRAPGLDTEEALTMRRDRAEMRSVRDADMHRTRDPFERVVTGNAVEVFAVSRVLRLSRLIARLWRALTVRP